MSWWTEPIWTLDLETTSADPNEAEIVQYALARVTPAGRVLEARTAVCQVEVWSDAAQTVHGITPVESDAGLSSDAAASDLMVSLLNLEPGPLVVFNARYDLTILNRMDVLPDTLHVLDPLVLDKHAHKYRKGKRQLAVMYAHYFGRAPEHQHDALADAVAAARVAFALARLYEVVRRPAAELHELQVVWAREQAESLQAYFRRTSDPQARVDGSWPVRSEQEVVS